MPMDINDKKGNSSKKKPGSACNVMCNSPKHHPWQINRGIKTKTPHSDNSLGYFEAAGLIYGCRLLITLEKNQPFNSKPAIFSACGVHRFVHIILLLILILKLVYVFIC